MHLIVNSVKSWSWQYRPWLSKHFVPQSVHPPSVGCVTIHYCTLPSGWLDCRSACCSIWPWGPSARAVWDLWGRLPAQEEGEGHAGCKWQWMVKWIVNVRIVDMAIVNIRRSEFLCFPGSASDIMWYVHGLTKLCDQNVSHGKAQPERYWKWKGNSNYWW